jgi:PhzF family phenazine biosynthesis protein
MQPQPYKIYQVDAFTNKVFSGNPAAIVPLTQWLQDATMQRIAAENNLAETAFYVPVGNQIHIRWFTPTTEVDLCGHATLAAAFVLYNFENFTGGEIAFYSYRSGLLTVTTQDDWFTLDFPTDTLVPTAIDEQNLNCLGTLPRQAFKGKTDYLWVLENEAAVANAQPNFAAIAQLDARGLMITARGEKVDFVSRFFGPQSGINEDPVTGSAHTSLIPFWAEQLGKTTLTALQLSERQGFLQCQHLGPRVRISGQAALYLIGEIYLAE